MKQDLHSCFILKLNGSAPTPQDVIQHEAHLCCVLIHTNTLCAVSETPGCPTTLAFHGVSRRCKTKAGGAQTFDSWLTEWQMKPRLTVRTKVLCTQKCFTKAVTDEEARETQDTARKRRNESVLRHSLSVVVAQKLKSFLKTASCRLEMNSADYLHTWCVVVHESTDNYSPWFCHQATSQWVMKVLLDHVILFLFAGINTVNSRTQLFPVCTPIFHIRPQNSTKVQNLCKYTSINAHQHLWRRLNIQCEAAGCFLKTSTYEICWTFLPFNKPFKPLTRSVLDVKSVGWENRYVKHEVTEFK